MRLILDSHALIWAVDMPAKIPATSMLAMRNPAVKRFISAATI